MKKIMYTTIEPTLTTDTLGNTIEYQWHESSEAEYGEEWDGNVQGYVENLELPEDIEIGGKYKGCVHNMPDGAIVLTSEERPVEMFWAI